MALHPRGVRDFLDALVALGMLERQREFYSNTADTDFFLDRAKPTYIGTFFDLWNVREYSLFELLSGGLKSGKPQNEIQRGEDDWVEAMYATPKRLRVFLRAMTGHSLRSAKASCTQKFHATIISKRPDR